VVISVVTVDTVVARKIHGVNSWIYVNIGPEDYLLAFVHTHNAHPQGGGYHEEDRTEQQCQSSLFLLVFQSLTTSDIINQTLKIFFCLILEY